LGGKIWGGRGCRSQIFTPGETVVCKRNRVDIFCHLSTMHERDKQIDRQTDHGTVTSISIRKIAFRSSLSSAMSPKNPRPLRRPIVTHSSTTNLSDVAAALQQYPHLNPAVPMGRRHGRPSRRQSPPPSPANCLLHQD